MIESYTVNQGAILNFTLCLLISISHGSQVFAFEVEQSNAAEKAVKIEATKKMRWEVELRQKVWSDYGLKPIDPGLILSTHQRKALANILLDRGEWIFSKRSSASVIEILEQGVNLHPSTRLTSIRIQRANEAIAECSFDLAWFACQSWEAGSSLTVARQRAVRAMQSPSFQEKARALIQWMDDLEATASEYPSKNELEKRRANSAADLAASEALQEKEAEALRKKMAQIILPAVNFPSGTALAEIIQFLNIRSTEYDPAGVGVNLIFVPYKRPALPYELALDAANPAGGDAGSLDPSFSIHEYSRPIYQSIDLQAVSLLKAVRHVASRCVYDIQIESNTVKFVHRDHIEALQIRSYPVGPKMFSSHSGPLDVTGDFRESGLFFPPGTWAIYDKSKRLVVVAHDAKNHKKVGAFIDRLTEPLRELSQVPNVEPEEKAQEQSQEKTFELEEPPVEDRLVIQKMKQIYFSQMAFEQAALDDVVQFLIGASRRVDPVLDADTGEGVGVKLILCPGTADPFGFGLAKGIQRRAVSLDLRKFNLYDTLIIVMELTECKFWIENSVIKIADKSYADSEVAWFYPRPRRNSKPIQGYSRKESIAVDDVSAEERIVIEKMKQIILPQVTFRRASICDVVSYLIYSSRALDSEQGSDTGEGVGVSMMLRLDHLRYSDNAPGGAKRPRVTIDLRNVSLYDVMFSLMETTRCKFRIKNGLVIITDKDHIDSVVTRFYPILTDIFEAKQYGGQIGIDVTNDLRNIGLVFPTGTSASYNRSTDQVVVVHGIDGHRDVKRAIDLLNQPIRVAEQYAQSEAP